MADSKATADMQAQILFLTQQLERMKSELAENQQSADSGAQQAATDAAASAAAEESQETGSSALLNVALVGKTGCGKSSLGNAMLGDKLFESNPSATSVTSECSLASAKRFNRRIRIVDTPGTVDTKDEKAAMKELCKAIKYCAEGFDSFLLVVRWGRFTEEEQKAIDHVQKAFGQEFYHFSIVVFTHCDNFDTEEQFRKGVESDRKQNKDLDKLLRKCSNRFLMIDNGRRCDKQLQQQQLRQIVEEIEAVRDGNCRRYSNDLFEEAQKQREEEQRLEREAKQKEEEQRRRGATEREMQLLKQLHDKERKEMEDKHQKELESKSGWCSLM